MSKAKGIVAALLLLAAGNALAIPISYQGFFAADIEFGPGGYEFDGGPISANYNVVAVGLLPGFSSTLGTLNSVTLSFASQIGHGMHASASDDRLTGQDPLCFFTDIEAAVDVFRTVRYTAFTVNVPSPSMTRSFEEHEACSVSSDDFVDVIACGSDSAPAIHDGFDGTFDLSGAALSDFIDLSQLILGFQFQAILSGTCQDDLGDHCTVLGGGIWNGLYQVTYDYTPGGTDPEDPDDPGHPNPTELPDPSPLLMWTTAFFGLAIARRRVVRAS
ncbi:MAG TPA: hypothetical protein VH814_03480 [Steroidobacteraceae bacterium]|jgi:hypothetical protein